MGDRFAGLFTASLYAILTDRVFLVKYPGFEAVFEPAQSRVNWLLDDALESCIMRASYGLDHGKVVEKTGVPEEESNWLWNSGYLRAWTKDVLKGVSNSLALWVPIPFLNIVIGS